MVALGGAYLARQYRQLYCYKGCYLGCYLLLVFNISVLLFFCLLYVVLFLFCLVDLI